jgi:pyruvate formate lyase activating enzyme
MVTGTIFDIKKFAVHDGPGIRTTVFFKGCPLDCAWCHNPESRSSSPESVVCRVAGRAGGMDRLIGREVSVETIMEEILKDEIFYDESGGGVTFSGGEPMIQVDFLAELLSRCREHSLHTAVDTCGCAPWMSFDRIYRDVQLFLYDLKLIDDVMHRKYTGVSNSLLHDNLRRLAGVGASIIVRVPMVPGITDTWENLDAIASLVADLPAIRCIDLLPYNKLGEDKIKRYQLVRQPARLETQQDGFLKTARERLATHGFDVRIGG